MIEQAFHAYTKDGHEFSALLEATCSAFRSDDWHSSKSESSWKDPIRQFFRRTGYYTDTFFKGSDTPRTLVRTSSVKINNTSMIPVS